MQVFPTVTTSLQWPSSATIPDKATVPACAGQDVTLAWDYSSTSEEHIVDVEWRYRADGGEWDLGAHTEHRFPAHSSRLCQI